MRVVRLILLGLAAYVVSIIVLFPAAPVIDRIEPKIAPVTLEGVSGRLYNGEITRLRYEDELLPLEFTNVGWRLAPTTVLQGGAGADVRFDGYGGGGNGRVVREWNGDIRINEFAFTVDSSALETLLPVPVAEFSGELSGDIDTLLLEGELLTELEGTLRWRDAVLERPVQIALGNLVMTIVRTGDDAHRVTLDAQGGDVLAEGTLDVALDGDFSTDILFSPSNATPPEVMGSLEQFARRDANGRYRYRYTGNVTSLM